ncbi:MAG: HD domain-containing protein [Nitrososphaerota archaeon]
MSGFSNIQFRDPGYPIVKGFIVPYRLENEIIDVFMLGEEEVRRYSRILIRMKEFISDCLSFCREQGIRLNRVEEIELVGDLIAIFLRAPLVRDVIPAVIPTPTRIHLLSRLGIFRERLSALQDPLSFLKSSYDALRAIGYLKPFNVLNDKALSEDLERCWFLFPADTRPGLNTSSLLAHLMLTSAIAWGLAVERGLDRESVAKLRLAAIIHDLGKPFDYRRHVPVSRQLAEELLGGTISGADEILEYVERHHYHADTVEARILKEADELASSIDRLVVLARELIGGELEKLAPGASISFDVVYGTGRETWEFWRELSERHPGSIEQLTKTFLKNLREKLDRFTKPIAPSPISGELERTSQELIIGLMDLGGIQDFITRFTDLRCVEAASIIVDSMTMAQMPILIHETLASEGGVHYPIEAILYAAGGVVEFIAPRKLLDDIIKKLNQLRSIIAEYRYPSIRFAWTAFSSSYTSLSQRLEREMRLKKLSPEEILCEIDWSTMVSRALCNICYDKPAEDNGRCKRCDDLYEFGTQVHFRRRYESAHEIGGKIVEPEHVFQQPWESISKYVVEVIAGHDWNELERKIRGDAAISWRNLAVIKVDGNLMGPFMSTSLSISDAYERSVRIDLALKKAFERSLDAVYRGVEKVAGELEAQKAVLSTIFGLLYMGGDDSLMLCPSWLSIALSEVLGNEFRLNMGGVRGLSIGVAVGNCRASIWSLVSAAGKLVEETKNAFRRNPELSGICFDIVETGGTLTGVSAKLRLSILRDELVSLQPIPINGERSLEALLKCALMELESLSYERVVERSYLLSRMKEIMCGMKEKIELEQDHAKKIISTIRECLKVANEALGRLPTSSDKILMKNALSSLVELYAQRQLARVEEDENWSYRVVLNIISMEDEERRAPFYDIERLLKIMGGGAF